jgi:RNA polymerase sigma-70 factor (ECF subfamily)
MRLHIVSDSGLVQQFAAGENAALEELLRRYKRKVFAYIVSQVRDQAVADDIFQDTFFKAIRCIRAGQYNEEGKFISWIMRIAHNLIIDFFRDAKKIPRNSGNEEWNIFDSLNLVDENVQDKLIRKQIAKDIRHMVEKLPEAQREIIRMRIFEEMSFKEIAEANKESINTSLGRFRYAVINLRKMMNKHKIMLEA